MDLIEVYRHRLSGGYRWRYLAGNNKKLASGGEGYANLVDLIASMARVCYLPESIEHPLWLEVSWGRDGRVRTWEVIRVGGNKVRVELTWRR